MFVANPFVLCARSIKGVSNMAKKKNGESVYCWKFVFIISSVVFGCVALLASGVEISPHPFFFKFELQFCFKFISDSGIELD